MIAILVNEKNQTVSKGATLAEVRERFKPDADVCIVNGHPAEGKHILKEGDRVILIRRGEIPKAEDLEALISARHTPGILKRLKKAIVGIAGLGGLGSSVAVALARMGIGTLILVDDDVVEPSNLNRQQYFIDHIGIPKTEATIKILSRINPFVRTVSHQVRLNEKNLSHFFEKADVIVECFDRAEEKKMLLEAAARELPGTFVVGASGIAGCGESNSIQTWRLTDRAFIVGDLVRAAGPGCGLMAPRVGIAAHHQANLVVDLIIDPAGAFSNIPEIV